MQPKPKPEPRPSPPEELGWGDAPQVRVDAEPATSPTPQGIEKVVSATKSKLPRVDAPGIAALTVGLLWAALGFLIAAVGLSLGIDRYWPDWDTAWPLMLIGTFLGVLPGLVSAAIGVKRIGDHAQLRRLLAVARGNDHLDIPTLAKLLETSEKKARRLAVEALARGVLDARYDAKTDRLVLKPSASPFR